MPGPSLATVPVPPSAFDGATEALAVLVLLVVFAMMREALLRSQVRLYAFQSLAVSVLAGVLGASQHASELFVLAGLSLALKVVIVPAVVLHLLAEAEVDLAGSHRFGVATAVLVGVVVSVVGFLAIGGVHIKSTGSTGLPVPALSAGVATVLVSFVLVMFRADVVSQAVGFFSMENGVSVASLVLAARMPLILEVGFLFDLLVAALAFGALMRAHHRRAASLSTETLDQLRG
ncbi:MAG: hydrogenase [Acidimicrobiales bacterium]